MYQIVQYAEIETIRFPAHVNIRPTDRMLQVGRWFEPLHGYPVYLSGIDKWSDVTDTIARTILNDRRIEDGEEAVTEAGPTNGLLGEHTDSCLYSYSS
jgi:hypothetical protein